MLKMVQDISNMVNIHYIRQKEPKGLGHAIHCAKSFIGNEPFLFLLGDDIVDADEPFLKQLIECYNEYKTSVLGVQTVAREDTCKYGILDVKHIEEGVYKVKDMVENQEPGKGGEIQLTDALQTLADHEAIYAYNFEGRRYDVGDKLGFLEATVDFALERPELRDDLLAFLRSKGESNVVESVVQLDEVAITIEEEK